MAGGGCYRPPTARPAARTKNEKMKKKPMFLHETAGGVPPLMGRSFDAGFEPGSDYLDTLPDMMEAVKAPRCSRAARPENTWV